MDDYYERKRNANRQVERKLFEKDSENLFTSLVVVSILTITATFLVARYSESASKSSTLIQIERDKLNYKFEDDMKNKCLNYSETIGRYETSLFADYKHELMLDNPHFIKKYSSDERISEYIKLKEAKESNCQSVFNEIKNAKKPDRDKIVWQLFFGVYKKDGEQK